MILKLFTFMRDKTIGHALFLILSLIYVTSAQATTYYVATSGNNSNPGTNSQPFRTIEKGVRSISAGDTLYVKSGTYTESIRHWEIPIANGTSWNNPITIAANPGHTVTVKPKANNAFFWIGDGKAKYLIIKGFNVDGGNSAKHGFKFEGGTKYVRVVDCEVKNTTNSGVLVSGSGNTHHEFINLNAHHNGSGQLDHGMYITTSNNLIDQSDIHHNKGYGVHLYSSTNTANNNIVRNVKAYDNNTVGVWGCGILLSSGTGNVAYNNTAYGNFAGLCTIERSASTRIYNNIAYGNDIYGIYVGKATNTSSRVENNTAYNNGTYGIFVGGAVPNATVKNNIARSNGTNFGLNGASSSHNMESNPQFVNAGAKNFRLNAGSPAINAGTTISGINSDHDGNSRPQGGSFDIGAYEFQGGSGGGGGSFPAPLNSPAPGSTLTTTSVTFTGGHTSQDQEHWLAVGTTANNPNLYNRSMGNSHTTTVSGLPTSGTIHVQYWTLNNSGWAFKQHTYTMSVNSGGGGGGGGGGTFPPAMSSPTPGATLSTRTVTFTGAHTSQDLEHWLEIGTSVGGSNLFQSGTMGASHSRTVSGLPSSGTIYVRYWTRNSSGWDKKDHTYSMTTSSGGSGGGGGTFPPAMSSPTPGATLSTRTVTFTGAHTSQDLEHWLEIGTSIGGSNLFQSGTMGASHSRTVSGLPSSGTIYVRYWTRNSSGWDKKDHTYTMR
ncbi:MAG: hypothetical protein NPIRA01_17130 [Nitrospirales bacterium]|nr:MAG: hypothetical protein NPIRA01_17130 [Nitrospirales bacterium]